MSELDEKTLKQLIDVLLEGTNAYPGYDRLVAASAIERAINEIASLQSINAELLAACEAALDCGVGSGNAELQIRAAIERANQ